MPYTDITSINTDVAKCLVSAAETIANDAGDVTVADNLLVSGNLEVTGSVTLEANSVTADAVAPSTTRQFLSNAAQTITGTKTLLDSTVIGNVPAAYSQALTNLEPTATLTICKNKSNSGTRLVFAHVSDEVDGSSQMNSGEQVMTQAFYGLKATQWRLAGKLVWRAPAATVFDSAQAWGTGLHNNPTQMCCMVGVASASAEPAPQLILSNNGLLLTPRMRIENTDECTGIPVSGSITSGGCLQLLGGLGVAKAVHCNTLTSVGNVTVNGNLTLSSTSTLAVSLDKITIDGAVVNTTAAELNTLCRATAPYIFTGSVTTTYTMTATSPKYIYNTGGVTITVMLPTTGLTPGWDVVFINKSSSAGYAISVNGSTDSNIRRINTTSGATTISVGQNTAVTMIYRETIGSTRYFDYYLVS